MLDPAVEDQGYASEVDLTFKFAIAATCFLVYDTLVHISDEASAPIVKYIWGGHQRWLKWTYVFVRHLPYLAQGSILTLTGKAQFDKGFTWTQTQCKDWITYQLAFNEALIIVVEGILIFRIYAMYNGNRSLTAIVLLLFVVEVTAMIAVLAVSIPDIEFTKECIITKTPDIFTSYWILSLSFETILFFLTLVKFFSSVSRRLGRQSILFLLFRDGTWAYAIIFLIMLTNILLYHIVRNPLAGLGFFWQLAIMSFAGAHVLLNLRRLAVGKIFSTGSPMLMDDSAPHFTPRFGHLDEGTESTDEGHVAVEMHDMKPSVTEFP
ncbi:uncharacterized protein FIBRA_08208 [Fibroporia radiculosa]|uniref:DUF6533 domain-containing protein n=1 Tax=Fibroporia radiculosa TaxID=599839 RepID=J4I2D1_9APHY|nr:uncharacterized protein FIBRA_08208 [Fibroporia radiculosa]CCM05967.1 predicted protein [Fibroporia radiculosa]